MHTTEVAALKQDAPEIGLSVVVPSYNEAEVLPAFYERMRKACASTGLTFEIVFVNDGSTDGTWTLIREFAGRDSSVVGLDLSRNHGHQLALTAGLHHARGLRILIIDADLQDPPELLPRMIEMLDRGADVVFGKREKRDGETWLKRATASAFYRLLNYLNDTPIPPDTGDFRLLRRNVLEQFLRLGEQPRFVRGMVSWLGFRQEAIPYNRSQRAAGESKYPFRKMLRFAFDAVTSFSIKPLKLATYLGLGAGFAALVLALYSIFEWFAGHTILGWTSLIVVVLLLGSAQLFVLGIIGEYLGRLTVQAKNRPLFIVREIYRGSASPPSASS